MIVENKSECQMVEPEFARNTSLTAFRCFVLYYGTVGFCIRRFCYIAFVIISLRMWNLDYGTSTSTDANERLLEVLYVIDAIKSGET